MMFRCDYQAGQVIAQSRIAGKNSRASDRRISELVSGLTGTEIPGNRLRVRVPCPPLRHNDPAGSSDPVGFLFAVRAQGRARQILCPDQASPLNCIHELSAVQVSFAWPSTKARVGVAA